MIKNYLKIAVRNAKRQKVYTLINILGLAGGITCCLLILLYVKFELSYDKFHEKADRIYRVALERSYPEGRIRLWGKTTPLLAQTLLREFPDITNSVRIMSDFGENSRFQVEANGKIMNEQDVMIVDTQFLDIFSISLKSGAPDNVFSNPASLIINERTAKKYFEDEDPIGKTMIFQGGLTLTVTGVCENLPQNSHFKFDFLASLSLTGIDRVQTWTNGWNVFTYILIHNETNPDELEEKIQIVVDNYFRPEIERNNNISIKDYYESGNSYRFFLQPLTDIHLRSNLDQEITPNGNIIYVYMFAITALFILLIACVNFMNLSTARSTNRAKEISMRKVFGSYRRHLIGQFLTESILMSLTAFLIAVISVVLILPVFNNITGQEYSLSNYNDISTLSGLFGFALLIGILSGSYPAFFLSSFRPVNVLAGKLLRGIKGSGLRNALVVFQFSISIALIIATLVIRNQIEYMVNKDIGFDKEHVLVIEGATALEGQKLESFKNELIKSSNIVTVSGSMAYPWRTRGNNTHGIVNGPIENRASIEYIFGDYDYIRTLGINILSGRDFSRDFASDSSAVLLNETAVKRLKLVNPLGSILTGTRTRPTLKVIGIVKDFHFKSLHNAITPAMIYLTGRGIAGFISVRIKPNSITETVSHIKNCWNEFTGNQPFSYTFLDDFIEELYMAEQRTGKLSGIFSVIAIVISCLGLMGLSAYTSEQRSREVGIRKVLGASVNEVLILFMKEYFRLIAISFIIALSASFYIMDNWLGNFAYETGYSFQLVFFAGLTTLFIAIFTVSYQVIKLALSEPVEVIRNN
ncbi:ABC transporter permease [candidate division KSB1 bacterium]